MKIEIPKMEDLDSINIIARQVHEIHVFWRPDLFVSVDEAINKEELEELINNEEIFVAKENNNIVGYVIIKIMEKNNRKMRYRKILEISNLGVEEKYRNKGIGTELLNFIKNKSIENNCTDLYLTVNEENKNAIKLYEKFGFRIKNIAYSMQIEKNNKN